MGGIDEDETEARGGGVVGRVGVKEGMELGSPVDEDASWGAGIWREEGLEGEEHLVHCWGPGGHGG